MTRVIVYLETFSVYVVVVSALIGTALNAIVQFYPIY